MKLLDKISNLLLLVGGVALIALMLHVSADVVFKRVFGMPIQGTTEMVSSYYMVACVFLGLGVVQRDGKQLAVEFFSDRLSPRYRAAVDIFAGSVMIVFGALLVWTGSEQAITNTLARETNWSTIARFEIWPTRWFPVIAYASMLGYLVIQLVRDIGTFLAVDAGERP